MLKRVGVFFFVGDGPSTDCWVVVLQLVCVL